MSNNEENTELHGNVYVRKSRSRAGSIFQTGRVDLVVSAVGGLTLLSSVFPTSRLPFIDLFSCF